IQATQPRYFLGEICGFIDIGSPGRRHDLHDPSATRTDLGADSSQSPPGFSWFNRRTQQGFHGSQVQYDLAGRRRTRINVNDFSNSTATSFQDELGGPAQRCRLARPVDTASETIAGLATQL